MTSVVRIRRKNGEVVQDCDIYIGRRINMGGWRLQDSIWRNPYPVKQYGLDKSLELYRTHLLSNPELMGKLVELKGKRLGCWCINCNVFPENPKDYTCHGQILMELSK